MFLRNILYEIKRNFRAKEVLIWMIIFPICLGLFYKLAFGNIGDQGAVTGIKVAVVENAEDKFFHMFYDKKQIDIDSAEVTSDDSADSTDTADASEDVTADAATGTDSQSKTGLEKAGEMLDPTFCSEEEAYKMLSDGDVVGIIVIDPAPGAKSSDTSGFDAEFFSSIYGQDWEKRKILLRLGICLKLQICPDSHRLIKMHRWML
ncbi:MAG: hypothetical protein IJS24_02140 [Eubacterium sp.]|nr:hypothetical protein [Eubacterium sp.]